MQYHYQKIRDEVLNLVVEASKSPNNYWGVAVHNNHVIPVLNYSLKLGKILKADLEVLELASLLHDYAGIVNYDFYPKHHIHGVRLAGEILEKTDFPKEKKELVQKCILNHRGSVAKEKESIEEKILASADAMVHISDLPLMFYLAYFIHKKEKKEGVEFIKNKLERSWNKIELKEGRELVQKDYEIAQYILNK